MSQDRVQIEVTDHVADVRLTRPEKHNALDWAMFTGINDAIIELGSTSGLRAVVLSGEGPSFCSGLDIASFMSGESEAEIGDVFTPVNGGPANVAQHVSYGWNALRVPVIAAIHGAAYGGGCQIALGADIRIATPDARMSVMEIKWGLIPDMAITAALPELCRADVARDLVYTGRIVDGNEALALGLVTRVAEDPHAAAMELATEIASKSPSAVQLGKRLLREAWRIPSTDGLALEEELQKQLIGSPNQMAAVVAGLSKQPGEFEDPPVDDAAQNQSTNGVTA